MTALADPMRSLFRGPLRVWAPALGAAGFLGLRLLAYHEFDGAELRPVASSGSERPAGLLDEGSAFLLWGAVAIACFAVAVRWRPFRGSGAIDPTRVRDAGLMTVGGWAGASIVCGLATAYFVAINTKFFDLLGLVGTKQVTAYVVLGCSWTLSWMITFDLCWLLRRHSEWTDRARRQFRSLLYANAALVAVGTLVSVRYFEAARARIEASGNTSGLVDALSRATALFYVLHLAVRFIPARLLLRSMRSSGAAAAAPASGKDPKEWPLKLLDAIANFSPVLAELAAGALGG
jgi:hypothetical protein